jgi:indolepyruvate ferredoxin oxidoreductase, beta subunit
MSAVPWRVVVAGVGGQGVLAAARFLAGAAHRAGLPVVSGELHGMAQRGGSVAVTVVIGSESSIVAAGTADVLVGAEPLEALRALPALRPGGLVLVDPRPRVPAALDVDRAGYPPVDQILAALAARAGRLVARDATALAARAGSTQVQNVVLLGMLAGTGAAPIPDAILAATILESCAPAARAKNERAFDLGRAETAPALPDKEEQPCHSR